MPDERQVNPPCSRGIPGAGPNAHFVEEDGPIMEALLRFTGAVTRDPAIDPAGLLQGAGRRMRHVKLKPGVVVDEPALETLVAAAYDDVGVRSMLVDR